MLSCQDLGTVRDLIVQPQAPWFSEGERILLDRSISGAAHSELGEVYLFVARLDGSPVGTVWYQVSRDTPEVGALAFVFTDPSVRGMGVAHALMGHCVKHFGTHGGLAMYLGTANPMARRIYESVGFRVYNGVAMRWTEKNAEDASFDEAFFSKDNPARTRRATWEDLPRLTALYAYPRTWFVKDRGERVFSHAELPAARSVSIGISLLLRSEGGNSLFVLENSRKRIGGALSVYSSKESGERIVMDLLVHPSSVESAPHLVEKGIQVARNMGGKTLTSYASDLDREKIDALVASGFVRQDSPEVVDLPSGAKISVYPYALSL